MVTTVPPAVGPGAGDTPVTVGSARYLNWSGAPVALVPPAVVTVTSTVPVPAGLVALSTVEDTNVTGLAAVPPNLTVAAAVKPVPVMVTTVPPAAGPDAGDTPVTVGPELQDYLARAEVALVPPAVVTVTSTWPVPAGLVALSTVEDTNVTGVAAVPPNLTVAAAVKPVPVMVTTVPPAAGPDAGDTPVTVGPV